MRWLDSIINSMDINLSKLREIVQDRGAWCAAVHEIPKSWTRLSKGNGTTDNKLPLDLLSANHTPQDIFSEWREGLVCVCKLLYWFYMGPFFSKSL